MSLPHAADYAEAVLLATGVLIWVTVGVYVHRRRLWGRLAVFPPQPVHEIQVIDLLGAVLFVWYLPPVLWMLFGRLSGQAPSTQPVEAGPAPPSQVAAMALGHLSAIGVLIFIGRRRFAGGWTGWGLGFENSSRRLAIALAAYLMIWPLCAVCFQVTTAMISWLAPSYPLPEHTSILTMRSAGEPLWVRALTVGDALLLAPIAEELVFRGLLQPALARWWGSTWAAILACGIAFGLFHLPLVHTVPALAIFGIVVGWLYAQTGSLTLVILVHVIFNGKTLLWVALGP